MTDRVLEARGIDGIARLIEDRPQDESKFLSLRNDNDSATLVFCGEPYAVEAIYTGQNYRKYDPKKHKGAPILVICFNVYHREMGTMRILNRKGKKFFSEFLLVRKKFGLDRWYELIRQGAANDKNVTYRLYPGDELTEAEKRVIHQTEMHNLEEDFLEKTDNQSSGFSSSRFAASGKNSSQESKPVRDTANERSLAEAKPTNAATRQSPDEVWARELIENCIRIIKQRKETDKGRIKSLLRKYTITVVDDLKKMKPKDLMSLYEDLTSLDKAHPEDPEDIPF